MREQEYLGIDKEMELLVTHTPKSGNKRPEFWFFSIICLFFISGNGKLASWTSILGFVVMMSLDVGLG